MPAHPTIIARIHQGIREAVTAGAPPMFVDALLDRLWESTGLATEWDATGWGFTSAWCRRGRAELLARANGNAYPTEPLMRMRSANECARAV